MSAKPTKILVAALVLTATSLSFVANASARPAGQSGWGQGGGEPIDTCMTDDGYGRMRSCSAGGA